MTFLAACFKVPKLGSYVARGNNPIEISYCCKYLCYHQIYFINKMKTNSFHFFLCKTLLFLILDILLSKCWYFAHILKYDRIFPHRKTVNDCFYVIV